MSQLLESIKFQNGVYHNLFHHEQRMNRSLKLLFGETEWFNLDEFLQQVTTPQDGLYKCRIIYDDQSKDIEFLAYEPKTINRLKIIEDNSIDYEHKYADRSQIDRLYLMKGNCDDILIVKNGTITDTSYANIIFKQKDKWVTPWSALLPGTQRQKLIELGHLHEEAISVDDIKNYQSFKLINAMVGFDGPEIDVSNIVY